VFDFIGDIHGHADKLREILEKLGYTETDSGYSHPQRKVFFLGDFIDRGLQIRESLEIVRRMIDSGNALAVMGNHEYNALLFHFPEQAGGHLRKHLIKNIVQHYETLRQFKNRQDEYEDYLDWFLTLPLYYETELFRAVHACWDQTQINFLKGQLMDGKLSESLIFRAAEENTALFHAVEDTLKGKELRMPDAMFFEDKEGNIRHSYRIKWWQPIENATFKNISIEMIPHLPDIKVPEDLFGNGKIYGPDEKPVFFGHYWLKHQNQPNFYRNNICCLDYSVAKKGHLAAYRFDGEQHLDIQKLVLV
jgi:hypothetical protein